MPKTPEKPVEFAAPMPCVHCGTRASIFVSRENGPIVFQYLHGQLHGYIQDVLPFLTNGEREVLMTGIHEACYDELFGGGE